jgi:UDP-glucuronate 4-epimerase
LKLEGFRFFAVDMSDKGKFEEIFRKTRPDGVLHLAAQPGVRYALKNPASYIQANLVAFANLLECCCRRPPRHLVFASSSSVYGNGARLPWAESADTDHPVSLYGATKKANELMAHAYASLHGLAATGLRYFTVYGPWGRPDMSPMLFARAILAGKPIAVYNRGDMRRDFTYIDDIVEGTLRVLDRPPAGSPPYALYNIGNHQPVGLLDYIAALERALGRKARTQMKPLQPGDALATCADTSALAAAVGFAPATPLDEGLRRFAEWFRSYYRHG